jgi:hypothetical protein
MKHDLYIYFSGNHYISGMCSRWDANDYSITIETWLKKGPFNDLNDNIRPGAVKELYKILGKPKFVDTSWTGENTLRLSPVAGTKLYKMRRQTLIYPKNITSTPIKGPSGWLQIKIEGYTSSNSL